jgi:t-SNARE complex subunit (syntaxin)
MVKYIDENDFKDFKHNFNVLINTFNHSVTELKEDVKQIRNDNNTQQTIIESIKEDVASIKATIDGSNKVIWWIMGIISAIIVAVMLSKFIGG